MAEKRPDTLYTSSAMGQRSDRGFTGLSRMVTLPYITANVDNGDTFTLHDGTTYFAPSVAIKAAAWQGVDDSDLVVAVVDADEQGVTFTSTGDNHNGYLHLWITG